MSDFGTVVRSKTNTGSSSSDGSSDKKKVYTYVNPATGKVISTTSSTALVPTSSGYKPISQVGTGGGSSGSAQTAPVQQEPQLTPQQINAAKDAFYGTTTTTTQISGADAARIARTQPLPMSIRDDTPYTYTTTTRKVDSTTKLQSVDNTLPPPKTTAPSTQGEIRAVEPSSEKELFGIKVGTGPSWSEQLSTKSDKLWYTAEFKEEDNVLKSLGLKGASMAVGAVTPAILFVENPFKFIKESTVSTWKLGTLDQGAWYTLGQEIKNNPARFVGNVGGTIMLFKGIGKTASVVGTPKVVETVFTSEMGGRTTVKSLALERSSGKSFILGSLKTDSVLDLTSKKGGFWGVKKLDLKVSSFKRAPDVTKELMGLEMDKGMSKTGSAGEGIRISTPTETKILQESLLKLDSSYVEDISRARSFIPTTQNIIKGTKGEQSQFIRDFAGKTEFLDQRATNIILQGAEESNAYVSGSFSRSGQLAKKFLYGDKQFELSKIPKDIDVHVAGGEPDVFVRQMTDFNRLRSAGYDVKIEGYNPKTNVIDGMLHNSIEIFSKEEGGYVKGVEYLNKDVVPEYTITPDMVVGFEKEGAKIKVGDNWATSLAEEVRGTTQGLARLRRLDTGKIDIYPREGRLKDVASTSVGARTLQQGLSGTRKGAKLLLDIEKFESFYPEDIVKGQVTEMKVADFSGSLKAPFVKQSGSGYGSLLSWSLGKTDSSRFGSTLSLDRSMSQSVFSGLESSSRGLKSEVSLSPSIFSSRSSPSPSPSIFSPSKTPSFYSSPSRSPSRSPSLVTSILGSPSPSPSRSPSPSPRASPSSSPSPSPSPSRSPYSSRSTYPSPSPSRSPYPSRSTSPSKRKESVGLFDVLVRESKPKGKSKVAEYRVSDFPMPRNMAINLGAKYADITTARTFRIVPKGKGYEKDVSLSFASHKFRGRKGRSKLAPNSFIEKSAFAIDTEMEKTGISLKGLLSKKKKGSWL